MDMEDLDMEFDWTEVDILISNFSPSLLNNPAYFSQQVNVPSVKTIIFLFPIPFSYKLIN